MAPELDQAPGIDHGDAIGIENGGEAVGDHNRGTPLKQLCQGLLNVAFRAGVERRGGFVQDQDLGVFEEGPGNGQALLLAPREHGAALTDLGPKPLGQLLDEFQRSNSALAP